MASSAEFQELNLTALLLRQYADAAIANATELLDEATLLCTNGHYARAYFLAVASIEETGKAFLAFDAQGRNLTDPAVTSRLKRSMEDHQTKIRSAFIGWITASTSIRDAVMPAIELMIQLQNGREPSMYTELWGEGDSGTVQSPSQVVRDVAARDCVRLAGNCMAYTRKLISASAPRQKSRADDGLFAMKSTDLHRIAQTEDFWWYYISELEAGRKDYSTAVVQYRKEFLLKGRLFQTDQGGKSGS